jgi:hypothetical protein
LINELLSAVLSKKLARFVRHIGVNDPIPEFTPVSSIPGLTPQLRARLNDTKVVPQADMAANNAATSAVIRPPLPAATVGPKPAPARVKRVDAN